MKKSTIVIIIVVIILVFIGGYWLIKSSSTSQAPMIPVSTSNPSTTATSNIVLTMSSNTALGSFVTAATNGMTLYTYKNDTVGESNCTDTCATTWPPYTVTSADNLSAVAGLSGTVGTITRGDGSLQVTYNGLPLYFYSQDTQEGDTNGNNIDNLWNVVTP